MLYCMQWFQKYCLYSSPVLVYRAFVRSGSLVQPHKADQPDANSYLESGMFVSSVYKLCSQYCPSLSPQFFLTLAIDSRTTGRRAMLEKKSIMTKAT